MAKKIQLVSEQKLHCSHRRLNHAAMTTMRVHLHAPQTHKTQYNELRHLGGKAVSGRPIRCRSLVSQ